MEEDAKPPQMEMENASELRGKLGKKTTCDAPDVALHNTTLEFCLFVLTGICVVLVVVQCSVILAPGSASFFGRE